MNTETPTRSKFSSPSDSIPPETPIYPADSSVIKSVCALAGDSGLLSFMCHAPFITIVSGLPRSGTSLMMQMLAAGGIPALTDQIRAADEDNPRGYLEFEAVKQTKTSPTWLKDAEGKAVKMVHLLLLDLPANGYHFRVLMMKRRIHEVLASQRTMLQRQGKAGANLSEAQLAQIFTAQMAKVENWLKQQTNFTVLPIDYNELMANPQPRIQSINQFLGGTLNCDAMHQSIDPQLYRQRMQS